MRKTVNNYPKYEKKLSLETFCESQRTSDSIRCTVRSGEPLCWAILSYTGSVQTQWKSYTFYEFSDSVCNDIKLSTEKKQDLQLNIMCQVFTGPQCMNLLLALRIIPEKNKIKVCTCLYSASSCIHYSFCTRYI